MLANVFYIVMAIYLVNYFRKEIGKKNPTKYVYDMSIPMDRKECELIFGY